MSKRKSLGVIKLNDSETLAFTIFFGLSFSILNFNNIFLKNIYPIIIESTTKNVKLFEVSYWIISILLVYETLHWIFQLAKKIEKRSYLKQLRIGGCAIGGFALGILLTNWLF